MLARYLAIQAYYIVSNVMCAFIYCIATKKTWNQKRIGLMSKS